MIKGLKKSILAFTVAAAVIAACFAIPAANNTSDDSQTYGYIFEYLIECS